MNVIKAPFTEQQVKNLNAYQAQGKFHPFTCCGGNYEGNDKCERQNRTGEGLLKASVNGWICPCGKYTQDWAHESMAEK